MLLSENTMSRTTYRKKSLSGLLVPEGKESIVAASSRCNCKRRNLKACILNYSKKKKKMRGKLGVVV